MPDFEYDLLVIGAGSGGVAASRRAAAHGARVAIVEAGRVGGTCVLRGCVPKKLLMYAAQGADMLAEAAAYGWDGLGEGAGHGFDMARWQARKTAELARLEGIYRQLLEGSGVALVTGHARLDGPQAVVVRSADGGEQRLRAREILIATGALPVRDSIPGIEPCASSDELLDLAHLPDSAAVIGGGYIGVEFASMLARFGVEVHLFFRDRAPLRGFDEMLRRAAAATLAAAGVTLHPGSVPSRIARPASGGFLLQFGEGRALAFPWVLNATGRRPNTAALGLASVGIAPGARGEIAVDAFGHTAVSHLHAIGDVIDRKNLTPVAIAEGRALADALFSGAAPRALDPEQIGSAVFMLPPLASIGPSEETLRERGVPLRVFETDFRPMRTAFVGGAERSHMKLLVHAETDRVLAVHMAGPDAPEIVQSLAVALAAGATKAHFDRTVAMHPTAAEEFVLMRTASR
jgi:glutathione reductase (NADPH)